MADIALPRPKTVSASSGHLVTGVAMVGLLMLLFYILASINWSAALSKAERCEVRGAFSNGFSKGFNLRRRACPAESNPFPLGIP
jgi:hypothetical protein